MNILLLGSGGREHTMAWKIKQSTNCDKLYIAPGNAGTQAVGENVAISVTDFPALAAFVKTNDIEMLIVGPEVPLVEGIVDYFRERPAFDHLHLIGPDAKAAQLEGSKDYAKQFMIEFGIPTASYQSFTINEIEQGKKYLQNHSLPIVLKADGLAAGKGVLICEDHETALHAFEEMLNGKFNDAGQTVVVESFLSGIEFSVFVATDGKSYQTLPIAKDYKRIGEGDTGLNTGGMGSVSPVSFIDQALFQKVKERIIVPTIKGIQARQLNYKGFIFFGLINVNGDPFVIEYNCRLGDPETQVVLPRLKSDLVDICLSISENKVDQLSLEFDDRYATAVIAVSGGYPEQYEKGKAITITSEIDDACLLFHAGTKTDGNQTITNGGRVIAVTSRANNLQDCLDLAYKNIGKINFEGKYFREDIGYDLK